MKYFILLFIFFYSCSFSNSLTSLRDVIHSEEIYYLINKDGTVNKDSITEIRKITYNQKWEFLSGTTYTKNKNVVLASDAGKYYVLPLRKDCVIVCEHDPIGRITRFKEQLKDSVVKEHFLLYDNWGNLSEDKSIVIGNNQQVSIITYEYIYLDDFTYAQRDGIRFISGMKNNYSNPWLIRTVKQNGKNIEYTERKIQN